MSKSNLDGIPSTAIAVVDEMLKTNSLDKVVGQCLYLERLFGSASPFCEDPNDRMKLASRSNFWSQCLDSLNSK